MSARRGRRAPRPPARPVPASAAAKAPACWRSPDRRTGNPRSPGPRWRRPRGTPGSGPGGPGKGPAPGRPRQGRRRPPPRSPSPRPRRHGGRRAPASASGGCRRTGRTPGRPRSRGAAGSRRSPWPSSRPVPPPRPRPCSPTGRRTPARGRCRLRDPAPAGCPGRPPPPSSSPCYFQASVAALRNSVRKPSPKASTRPRRGRGRPIRPCGPTSGNRRPRPPPDLFQVP